MLIHCYIGLTASSPSQSPTHPLLRVLTYHTGVVVVTIHMLATGLGEGSDHGLSSQLAMRRATSAYHSNASRDMVCGPPIHSGATSPPPVCSLLQWPPPWLRQSDSGTIRHLIVPHRLHPTSAWQPPHTSTHPHLHHTRLLQPYPQSHSHHQLAWCSPRASGHTQA